jgi:hypothetical protein
MRKKRQEFMDLKQGGRSMHNYSKLFNHLAQYTPDQVDTDEEKKDRFMIGLSTKLQECMALNTGRLWQLHPEVLPQSTGRYTTTAPPIHLDNSSSTSTNVSSSSGLPAHLSAHNSGQHLRLYLHPHLCYACLRH